MCVFQRWFQKFMCLFQCCHLVTIRNISAWCLKGQCIFIKSGSTFYTWCNPIMSYNWMWGLKKCNNSGRSWMCNRQKLNENQMCNKPNVCGIAHLYHIVQFLCPWFWTSNMSTVHCLNSITEYYPECLSSHLKNSYELQCFYHSVKTFSIGTET